MGALLEDAETKNAALERVEELEENMSHVSVLFGSSAPPVSFLCCLYVLACSMLTAQRIVTGWLSECPLRGGLCDPALS